MRKSITSGLTLLAAMTAFAGDVQAYVNYPWCAIGESRGTDCVFASKEQCAADGRGRGFGGQCIQNPSYDPRQGSVIPSGNRLNSLGRPLHNPPEGPIIGGAQGKAPDQGRRKSPSR